FRDGVVLRVAGERELQANACGEPELELGCELLVEERAIPIGESNVARQHGGRLGLRQGCRGGQRGRGWRGLCRRSTIPAAQQPNQSEPGETRAHGSSSLSRLPNLDRGVQLPRHESRLSCHSHSGKKVGAYFCGRRISPGARPCASGTRIIWT